tara:strand:+ start:302 stop:637 length:336 start_codon:yes stop_codon:yes gene_type:complete
MKRCDTKKAFLFLESVEILGVPHPYLQGLIKELVVYGGDASTGNKPTIPLLADWAQMKYECKDECLEHCTISVEITHLYHYLAFMCSVILVCSLFVMMMTKWGRKLKLKKY